MKFQLKLLALATLGLAASVPAHASIATTGSGNGGLFLSVWDNNGTVNDTTDDRGMTVNLNSVLGTDWSSTANTPVFNAVANTAGTTRTYTDAGLTSWIGASANLNNLQWNVFAGDAVGAKKFVTTISTFPSAFDQAALNSSWSLATDSYLAAVNALMGSASSVSTTPSNGAAYAGTAWGSNVGAQAGYGFNNAGSIGDKLAFWSFYETSTTSGGVKTFQYASLNDNGALLHDGSAATFSLAGNGTLTYSVAAAAPAAVPVPAAAWLLGSGLLGLVGVARRKSA